ncbi:MAG: phenylacetate--CoA ligase, partial [Desulfuromusa sp.]|nr:phenylacetate--CoA ligase [Desulfuromusa sp.]
MNQPINIWNRDAECLPREDIRQLQLNRLQKTLSLVANNVPCYQVKFKDSGFQPGDLQSLKDLQQLPFTTKEDLRVNYPYGMFAVPMREVVRIHSSSGTTGKPTVVGYTKEDINIWTGLVARFMTAAGVTAEDIVHIAFGYG